MKAAANAAYAASYDAYAAANAAYAAYDAYAAANAAPDVKKEMQWKILEYGMDLMKEEIK